VTDRRLDHVSFSFVVMDSWNETALNGMNGNEVALSSNENGNEVALSSNENGNETALSSNENGNETASSHGVASDFSLIESELSLGSGFERVVESTEEVVGKIDNEEAPGVPHVAVEAPSQFR
jgi:hypothetical protein